MPASKKKGKEAKKKKEKEVAKKKPKEVAKKKKAPKESKESKAVAQSPKLKNFMLLTRDDSGRTFEESGHIFTNRAPRAAALRAAGRGYIDIYLLEASNPKIHHFKGGYNLIDSKDKTKKVKRPYVLKIGMIDPTI